MRIRIISLVVLAAALIGGGTVYATAASGRRQIPVCSAVHVSGGPFNGAGGSIESAVTVRNTGSRACKIDGRPWIRLGPTRYPVTVADATPGMYGNAGAHERTLTLAPGQHTVAQVITEPGSCTRGVDTMFSANARAGWAGRSVPIGSGVCKNGSGEIWVGSFQR